MLRKILLVFTICINFATTKGAVAADADNARLFVDNIGKQVLSIIDSSKTDAQKQVELRKMFIENVDLNWMGRFVLGAALKQATEEQQKRYLKTYQKYMLTHYTSKFSDYTNSKYTITDVQDKNDGQIIVNMQIKTSKDSQETLAGYRLSPSNKGKFKIVDIIIEGVSLVTTQRDDFGSISQSQGIEGLINSLEAKANQ